MLGFSCTARTADATGSGWAGTTSNRIADLDAGALAKIAVDKAHRSANPKRLDPGRYTVVLEPAAVAALLDFLIDSLGARRADEGPIVLREARRRHARRREAVPRHDHAALRSRRRRDRRRPVRRRGPATRRDPMGRQGHDHGPDLRPLLGEAAGAKHATGSRRNGWTLDGGAATIAELIKPAVKRGVLITRFWYLRDLDPQTILTTGLTRDGTFLIENGELAHPVNNFRFNESPVQMLARCDGLGADWIAAGDGAGRRAPALRSQEFHLASISDAV